MNKIFLASVLIFLCFLTISDCQTHKKDPIKIVNSLKGGLLSTKNQTFTTVRSTNTNTTSNATTP